MSNKIAQITAAFILGLSVVAIMFGSTIGAVELTEQSALFLGVITGGASTFLFLAKTKNNGTHVATNNPDV